MEVGITTEYIALGQFLKFVGCIDNGAAAKHYLIENEVFINGSKEDRRGRKIYPGDIVKIIDTEYKVVKNVSGKISNN